MGNKNKNQYVVQKGDSWERIAGNYYGDQRQYAYLAWSNGGFGRMLQPGDVIHMPPKLKNPNISPEMAAYQGMSPSFDKYGAPTWDYSGLPSDYSGPKLNQFDPAAFNLDIPSLRQQAEPIKAPTFSLNGATPAPFAMTQAQIDDMLLKGGVNWADIPLEKRKEIILSPTFDITKLAPDMYQQVLPEVMQFKQAAGQVNDIFGSTQAYRRALPGETPDFINPSGGFVKITKAADTSNNLPWWQPGVYTALSNPATAPLAQGALPITQGVITGNPTMIALGLANILAGYGAQSQNEWVQKGSQAFAEVLMKLSNTAEQVLGSVDALGNIMDNYRADINNPQIYHTPMTTNPESILVQNIGEGLVNGAINFAYMTPEERRATWEAAKMFYEQQGAKFGNPISGRAAGEVWKLGATHPVKVDDLDLQDYKQRIIAGDNPEVVFADYQLKYGITGQGTDLVLSSIFDPLNLVGEGQKLVGEKYAGYRSGIAQAAGDVRGAKMWASVEHAFSLAHEAGIGDLVNYEIGKMTGKGAIGTDGFIANLRDMIRTGQLGTVDELTGTDSWSKFARAVAGLDAEGKIRQLDGSKTSWLAMMASMTPDAKARVMHGLILDNLKTIFDQAEHDPVEMVKLFNTWAKGDTKAAADAGAAYLGAPEAYTTVPAIRMFEKGSQELLQSWLQHEPGRQIITAMAAALGETPDDLVLAFKNGHGQAELGRFTDAVSKLNTPEAKQYMDMISSGQLTFDTLGKIIKPFADGEAHATSLAWKADFMSGLSEASARWMADYFGIKPDSTFFQIAKTMKNVQSLMLLAFSPSYPINNGMTNMVTRAASGVFGFMPGWKIDEFMEKFGVEPSRLRSGIGPIGDTMDEGAFLKGETIIRDASTGKGFWQSAQRLIGGASNALGVFGKVSGAIEKAESKQAFYFAMKRYWSRLWREGVGFDRMPDSLRQSLDHINPNYKDIIYASIRSGLSWGEIKSSIQQATKGAAQRTVSLYLDHVADRLGMQGSDVVDILESAGVMDEITSGLKDAKTAGEINQVFDRIDKQAQDWSDIQSVNDLKAEAGRIAETVKAEGFPGTIDLWDELKIREMEHKFRNDSEWDAAYTEAANWEYGSAERRAIIKKQMERSTAEWRRMQAYEAAAIKGIADGLHMRDNLSVGIVSALTDEHKQWQDFHTYAAEQRKKYFDTIFGSKEARNAAWSALEQDLNDRHAKVWKNVLTDRETIGKLLEDHFETTYGLGAGRGAREWMAGVSRVDEQMREAMSMFRKGLEGMNPADRDKAWAAYKPEYQKLWRDRMLANAEGIRNLYRVITGENGPDMPSGEAAPPHPGQPQNENTQPTTSWKELDSQVGDMTANLDDIKRMLGQTAQQAESISPSVEETVSRNHLENTMEVWQKAAEIGMPGTDEAGNLVEGSKLALIKMVKGNGFGWVTRFDEITPDMLDKAHANRQAKVQAQPELTPAQDTKANDAAPAPVIDQPTAAQDVVPAAEKPVPASTEPQTAFVAKEGPVINNETDVPDSELSDTPEWRQEQVAAGRMVSFGEGFIIKLRPTDDVLLPLLESKDPHVWRAVLEYKGVTENALIKILEKKYFPEESTRIFFNGQHYGGLVTDKMLQMGFDHQYSNVRAAAVEYAKSKGIEVPKKLLDEFDYLLESAAPADAPAPELSPYDQAIEKIKTTPLSKMGPIQADVERHLRTMLDEINNQRQSLLSYIISNFNGIKWEPTNLDFGKKGGASSGLNASDVTLERNPFGKKGVPIGLYNRRGATLDDILAQAINDKFLPIGSDRNILIQYIQDEIAGTRHYSEAEYYFKKTPTGKDKGNAVTIQRILGGTDNASAGIKPSSTEQAIRVEAFKRTINELDSYVQRLEDDLTNLDRSNLVSVSDAQDQLNSVISGIPDFYREISPKEFATLERMAEDINKVASDLAEKAAQAEQMAQMRDRLDAEIMAQESRGRVQMDKQALIEMATTVLNMKPDEADAVAALWEHLAKGAKRYGLTEADWYDLFAGIRKGDSGEITQQSLLQRQHVSQTPSELRWMAPEDAIRRRLELARNNLLSINEKLKSSSLTNSHITLLLESMQQDYLFSRYFTSKNENLILGELTKSGADINAVIAVMNEIKMTLVDYGWYMQHGKMYDFQDYAELLAHRQKNLLFQEQAVPVWYSRLERAISAIPQKVVTAEQIRGVIKSAGIKADEMYWTGFEEWLAGQEGKINTADALDYIRENGVQIKEVTRSDSPSTPETKHSVYQLEGGSNYREVLFTLPQRVSEKPYLMERERLSLKISSILQGDAEYQRLVTETNRLNNELSSSTRADRPRIISERDKLDSLKEARANEITGSELSRLKEIDQLIDQAGYQSSHWSEQNVLAHTRLNDRIDEQGRRILFVEEVQSDWHQAGRDNGYGEGGVSPAPFSTTWHELVMKRIMRMAAENGYDGIAWTTGRQQIDRYSRLARAVADRISYEKLDVTYKIDGKWDAIGRQGTEGFNHYMATQPENVTILDNPLYEVTSSRNGRQIAQKKYTANELRQTFGGEIADQIIKSQDPTGEITGDNISVGGQGMINFYDEKLKSWADKYSKKWGVQTSDTEIRTDYRRTKNEYQVITEETYNNVPQQSWDIITRFPDTDQAQAYIDANPGTMFLLVQVPAPERVHFLPINDAMRASVLEGQPLFQRDTQIKGAANIMADGRTMLHMFDGADVSTLVHETAHIIRPYINGDDMAVLTNWVNSEGSRLTQLRAENKLTDQQLTAFFRDGQDITPIVGDTWTRSHEEIFARAFEKYLAEGVAPLPTLKRVFQQFKNWLITIYRSITGSSIDVNLTDEVRAVFDNLLSKQDAEFTLDNIASESGMDRHAVTKMILSQYENADAARMDAHAMISEDNSAKFTAEGYQYNGYTILDALDWMDESAKAAADQPAAPATQPSMVNTWDLPETDARTKMRSMLTAGQVRLLDMQDNLGYPSAKFGNLPETNPVNKMIMELRDQGIINVSSGNWGEGTNPTIRLIPEKAAGLDAALQSIEIATKQTEPTGFKPGDAVVTMAGKRRYVTSVDQDGTLRLDDATRVNPSDVMTEDQFMQSYNLDTGTAGGMLPGMQQNTGLLFDVQDGGKRTKMDAGNARTILDIVPGKTTIDTKGNTLSAGDIIKVGDVQYQVKGVNYQGKIVTDMLKLLNAADAELVAKQNDMFNNVPETQQPGKMDYAAIEQQVTETLPAPAADGSPSIPGATKSKPLGNVDSLDDTRYFGTRVMVHGDAQMGEWSGETYIWSVNNKGELFTVKNVKNDMARADRGATFRIDGEKIEILELVDNRTKEGKARADEIHAEFMKPQEAQPLPQGGIIGADRPLTDKQAQINADNAMSADYKYKYVEGDQVSSPHNKTGEPVNYIVQSYYLENGQPVYIVHEPGKTYKIKIKESELSPRGNTIKRLDAQERAANASRADFISTLTPEGQQQYTNMRVDAKNTANYHNEIEARNIFIDKWAREKKLAAQAQDIITGNVERVADDVRRGRLSKEDAISMVQEAVNLNLTNQFKLDRLSEMLGNGTQQPQPALLSQPIEPSSQSVPMQPGGIHPLIADLQEKLTRMSGNDDLVFAQYYSGDSKGELRQKLYEALTGEKLPKSKTGVNALQAAYNRWQEKNKKLGDFGEYMPGARKNQALETFTTRNLEDKDISAKPLSEIWPKAEIDAIEDNGKAAIASYIRNKIPAKPRSPYKIKWWVEKVKAAKALMEMADQIGVDAMLQRPMNSDHLQLVNTVKVFTEIPREQWGRVSDVAYYPNATTRLSDGTITHTGVATAGVDGKGVRAKNISDLVSKIQEILHVSKQDAANTIQFEVRRDNQTKKFFINKKGDPMYRELANFDTADEAFHYKNNNRSDLVTAWESVKERDNVKETDVRGEVNRPRSGKDYRQGKDATPEMFTDAFGFRGVEFGNWVSQGANLADRQGMLNAAYDALFDMADILNIPTKAISLNGALGLAMGSRGAGRHSAHYEADTVVINLTKTRGAGALAHEWLHALDNYFGKQKNSSNEGYITNNPSLLYVNESGHALTAKEYNRGIEHGRIKPGEYILQDGVRPEMATRFAELVKALDESPMRTRAARIDKGKSDGYWSRTIERAARSFENYIIYKMEQLGYQNDYLANVVKIEKFNRNPDFFPYLRPSELAPIVEAFDLLFADMKTKETDKGVMLYQEAPAVETRAFRNWFGDSKIVDANGQPLVVYHGGTRWNTPDMGDRGAIWLTDRVSDAAGYADQYTNGEIKPLYASIKNPLDLRDPSTFEKVYGISLDKIKNQSGYSGNDSAMARYGFGSSDEFKKAMDYAKANGFDGIIHYDTNVYNRGPITSYVIFDPSQIKLAKPTGYESDYNLYGHPLRSEGNRGTFDPNNPNILYQKEPISQMREDGLRPPEEQDQPKSQLFQDGGPTPLLPPGGYQQISQQSDIGRITRDIYNDQIKPILNGIKQQAIKSPNPVSMNGLDPKTLAELDRYLRQVKGQMSGSKLTTVRWGETVRDFALLPYHRQHGFDKYLNVAFPYQFYMTRSMANWMLRALDRPAWFANYARLQKAQQAYQNNLPERMRGKVKIPMPFLPEWAGGGVYVDPTPQLFPFKQFSQPMDAYLRDATYTENNARYIVQDWVDKNQVTAQEAQQALKTKSGPTWERALQQAKQDRATESPNGFDYASMLISPALYATIPYYLATGKQMTNNSWPSTELPITRTGNSLQTAFKGTALEWLGNITGKALAAPEYYAREKLGLPQGGEFAKYFVERQLANMAAEGKYPVNDIKQAMIEGANNPIYKEAVQRAQQEAMYKVPGMLPMQQAAQGNIGNAASSLIPSLFPQGILPQAELELRGQKAEYNRAWDMFKKGDEKALTDFFDKYPEYESRLYLRKDPEERLRNFLVSTIWDSYGQMDTYTKKVIRESMGKDFTDAFLSDATRSYDSVSLDKLAIWARLMGAQVPKTDQVSPDAANTQPLDRPDPAYSARVSAYYAKRDEMFPNYFVEQDAYYALPVGQDRKNYLLKHPDLKKYWDWKQQILAANPDVALAIEKQDYQKIDTSSWHPLLLKQIQMYGMAGQNLTNGAEAMLRQYWIAAGKPGKSMQVWLKTTVLPAVMYANQP